MRMILLFILLVGGDGMGWGGVGWGGVRWGGGGIGQIIIKKPNMT